MRVGKYEHLQEFKNGFVFFSSLETFRNDSTLFRGDPLEGKLLIDTTTEFKINGIDFSSYTEEVQLSNSDSENVVTFCASILDNNNSQLFHNNRIVLCDDFYNEMRKFGQYAVIFDSTDLTKNIQAALNNKKCASAWGPVSYFDKRDPKNTVNIFRNNKSIFEDAAIYFMKGIEQAVQNEWRYVIDYIDLNSPLKRNSNKSIKLRIDPFSISEIIDLDIPQR